jgi:cell division protein FtsN
MLLGIGIGLVIAAGIYYRTAWQPGERSGAPQPAAANGVATPPAAAPRKAAAPSKSRAAPSAAATPVATPDRRFEFYDILPQYEVVVPEVESVVGAGAARVKPIQEPGSYVLQAGSFGAAADADKVKASIALLGVESRIQRVTVDDAVFHRVRIGPISDLAELNRVRKRLHDAHIDAVVMKAME